MTEPKLTKEQIEARIKFLENADFTGIHPEEQASAQAETMFEIQVYTMALASLEADASVDCEIDRWQALLVHHEQLEDAAKAVSLGLDGLDMGEAWHDQSADREELRSVIDTEGFDDTMQAILDARIRQARIEGAERLRWALDDAKHALADARCVIPRGDTLDMVNQAISNAEQALAAPLVKGEKV